jgi:hypothetical protein
MQGIEFRQQHFQLCVPIRRHCVPQKGAALHTRRGCYAGTYASATPWNRVQGRWDLTFSACRSVVLGNIEVLRLHMQCNGSGYCICNGADVL